MGYDELFVKMKLAVESGVDIVQLRDKLGASKDALKFCRKALRWLNGRAVFIVNDRVDIALIAGAHGVHLGQDDLPVPEARKLLGRGKIIGKSCQTVQHLRQALAEGADYVGFGSVFKTLTKPDRQPMAPARLKAAVRFSRGSGLPLFAIGGVTKKNLRMLAEFGVSRAAVCRDILKADDVASSVGEIKKALDFCS